VVWVAVLIVVASWVLVAARVLEWWVPFVVTSAAIVLGAWWLDRTGRGTRASARLDPNRPDFYGPMASGGWEVPTSYIDHPTGGGPPPGVEPYDEAALDDMNDGEGSRLRGSEDPAP